MEKMERNSKNVSWILKPEHAKVCESELTILISQHHASVRFPSVVLKRFRMH